LLPNDLKRELEKGYEDVRRIDKEAKQLFNLAMLLAKMGESGEKETSMYIEKTEEMESRKKEIQKVILPGISKGIDIISELRKKTGDLEIFREELMKRISRMEMIEEENKRLREELSRIREFVEVEEIALEVPEIYKEIKELAEKMIRPFQPYLEVRQVRDTLLKKIEKAGLEELYVQLAETSKFDESIPLDKTLQADGYEAIRRVYQEVAVNIIAFVERKEEEVRKIRDKIVRLGI
jgi:hypothetical protein